MPALKVLLDEDLRLEVHGGELKARQLSAFLTVTTLPSVFGDGEGTNFPELLDIKGLLAFRVLDRGSS